MIIPSAAASQAPVNGIGMPSQPGDLKVQPRPGAGDTSGTIMHVALGLDPGNDAPAEAPTVLVREPVHVEEGTQQGKLAAEIAGDIGAEQPQPGGVGESRVRGPS
ncbi:hypothetical protein AB0L99_37635 [Streptomyces sp. NPDC051954]|uniref:hypothetical protein n=1 Tax=unclassified Streptomyces TaxID=2593676 RepID=UPI003418681F